MSVETARAHLARFGRDQDILLLDQSSATVELAAQALGTAFFHEKAKMLSPEEVLEYTSHPVGGVCPFGVPENVRVYLDESLRRFAIVYPACGSGASAIALTCDELAQYSGALQWVDVCKGWRDAE